MIEQVQELGTIQVADSRSGKSMARVMSLFAEVPADVPEELFETILSTPSFRVERIISRGHFSPEGFWYDQETHEWVLLLKGAARLTLEGGEPIDMLPGSFVNIPAHQRHRVEWTDPTQPTIWLAIHYEGEAEPEPKRETERKGLGTTETTERN
jgi:cupin 2 domain-containing protein